MSDETAQPWLQRLKRGEQPREDSNVTKVPLKPEERREYVRLPFLVNGMIFFGSREIACLIDNVSAGGLGLIATGGLDGLEIVSGTVLAVRVDGYGVLAGVVAWRSDNRLGVRFLDAPERTAELLGLRQSNSAIAKSKA